jgi:hypothetical protein
MLCARGERWPSERIGDIPITRDRAADVAGEPSCRSGLATVPRQPGALVRRVAGPGFGDWRVISGCIGRAGHRRGDVAACVRKQSRGPASRASTAWLVCSAGDSVAAVDGSAYADGFWLAGAGDRGSVSTEVCGGETKAPAECPIGPQASRWAIEPGACGSTARARTARLGSGRPRSVMNGTLRGSRGMVVRLPVEATGSARADRNSWRPVRAQFWVTHWRCYWWVFSLQRDAVRSPANRRTRPPRPWRPQRPQFPTRPQSYGRRRSRVTDRPGSLVRPSRSSAAAHLRNRAARTILCSQLSTCSGCPPGDASIRSAPTSRDTFGSSSRPAPTNSRRAPRVS